MLERASFQVHFTEVSFDTSEDNQLSYYQNGYFFIIRLNANRRLRSFSKQKIETKFVAFFASQSLCMLGCVKEATHVTFRLNLAKFDMSREKSTTHVT